VSKGPKRAVVYFLLALAFCLLLLPPAVSNRLKISALSPVEPLQRGAFRVGATLQRLWATLVHAWIAVDERKALEQQVFRLQNQVTEQQSLLKERTAQIENVATFHQKFATELPEPVVADVIGFDSSNLRRSMLISAGAAHGVETGDVVLYFNALVGYISAAGGKISRVQLLLDPATRVPAIVLDTRDPGIVEGTGSAACRMKYVQRFSTAKEGHQVVTSGLDGTPKGILIGAVARAARKPGALFKTLEVSPRVDFSRVENVLVVKRMKPVVESSR